MLSISNLTKSFSGIKALDNLSLEIKDEEIVGLIGPNGSGKTTLFNIITNLRTKDEGSINYDGFDISHLPTHQIANLGISRTFQDSCALPQISVRENIDIAFKYHNPINLFSALFRKKSLLGEENDHLEKMQDMLKEFNLEQKLNELAKKMSYGQGKLLEMIKIMAFDGKLLLLDEPFAGLFPEIITLVCGIIKKLAAKGKTIVLVEHNMALIEEICDKVIVLDAGRKIAEGKYADVKKNKVVIEAYLGK